MATSWKLPSAAAAARSSGAAPTPPAGPAPPPGPAKSAARALPLGRRGSPRRGGRCRLRGLLGLVVCELGGRGGQCWGASARRPAACPWAEPAGVLRPRPRKPVPWEESGVLRAPQGSPPPSRLHHVGACKGTGTPANVSVRWLRRLRLSSRCPDPHLMLRSKPGRDPGRDPRVRPGGLPGPGTSLQRLAQWECAGGAVRARDWSNREGELDGQDIRWQVTITLPAPKGLALGQRLNGVWAKRTTAPNACAFSLLISLPKSCTKNSES